MSDLSNIENLNEINNFFLQAKDETSKYNWYSAIELLKKIEKFSIDGNLKKIEGEVCYKLGEIYHIASQYEDNEENVLEFLRIATKYFQKAQNIFQERFEIHRMFESYEKIYHALIQ